jgi:hypothetical protein
VITQAPLGATALATETVIFELADAFQLETGAADGDYYAIAGQVQAGPGRPVQPLTSQVVPIKTGQTAHGAVLVAAVTDRTTGFNPLVSRPVTDTKLSEPAFAAPAWFPSKPWSVNRLAEQEQLVVVPAQFRGDQDTGILRRFTELTFEVYYADTANVDFSAPVVWQVGSQSYGEVGDFWVATQDTSGIQRVVMAYSRNGVNWQVQDFRASPSIDDRWETRMSILGDPFIYFVQVVDGAGNVTVSSNKGLFFTPPRNIYLPVAASLR